MTAKTAALPALDPLDFLAVDALLDEEERAIRDTVRAFVRERIVPDVGDWFERGILPREVLVELAGLGQPEAADQIARVHSLQPALFLFLGAPAPDGEHRQRSLHRDRAARA